MPGTLRVATVWLWWRRRTLARSWIILGLLTGLAWGISTAAMAGARRTDTAYRRLYARARPPDVVVSNGDVVGGPHLGFAHVDLDQVARLPGVAAAFVLQEPGFGQVEGWTSNGRPVAANLIASTDPRFATSIDRPLLLAGRLPNPDRTDEAVASFYKRDQAGFRVGTRLFFHFAPPGAFSSGLLSGRGPGTSVEIRIVGIEATPEEFPTTDTGYDPAQLVLTPAFLHVYASQLTVFDSYEVRLAPGTLGTFERALAGLGGKDRVAYSVTEDKAANVKRAMHVQGLALGALGIALAAVAMVMACQALVRRAWVESGDRSMGRALGVARSEFTTAGALRGLTIGLIGAVMSLLVAVALSSLTPVGEARYAEPHPGTVVNVAILGLTAAALVAAFMVVSTIAEARVGSRPQRAVSAASRSTVSPLLPVTGAVGVTMALRPGKGADRVPVISTISGVAVAVAILVTAIVTAASLQHLLGTPSLYGINWNYQVGADFQGIDRDVSLPPGVVPAVSAAAEVSHTEMDVGGTALDVLALRSIRGTIAPTIVAGRLPVRSGEILLGTRTLANLGRHLGDRITVQLGTHRFTMTIVGRAVLPPETETSRLGEGGLVTLDFLQGVLPDVTPTIGFVQIVAPGSDRANQTIRQLDGLGFSVHPTAQPLELANIKQVDAIPWLLVLLLALAAIASVIHLLLTSIRHRRRDLIVLKVLGFSRRQLVSAMVWETGTILLASLAVALPVGMLMGRVVWNELANQLGVASVVIIPPGPIFLLLAGAVVTLGCACLPALLAARGASMESLRPE